MAEIAWFDSDLNGLLPVRPATRAIQAVDTARFCRHRTIFISDTHLGTPGCKAEALANFLAHNECETLFLVGDIVDGWRRKRRWFWPEAQNQVVGEILRKSEYRAAVIGSSSWSHAFLTRKHHGLYPDVAADRVRFEELRQGRQAEWRNLSLDTLVDSGQHEMLNWICLAGAMEGRKPDYLEMFESHIFNSNKVSAIFRP